MSELYCRVETPMGSRLGGGDTRQNAIECPVDCGYFPQTVAGAGRALEAIVCASAPHRPGGTLAVKPIALLHIRDGGWDDEVVLCVALDDPAWSGLNRADELPAALRASIERFVTTRRASPDTAAIVGWGSRDDALTAIDDAAAHWAATVNGHG